MRNFDVAVIAIGSDIQSSILITLLTKELGVKYVVAKAQNLVSSNIHDYIELAPKRGRNASIVLLDKICTRCCQVNPFYMYHLLKFKGCLKKQP